MKLKQRAIGAAVCTLIAIALAGLGVAAATSRANQGNTAVVSLEADPSNPFGVMLGGGTLTLQQRLALSKELGAAYFRPWDVTVEDWTGVCGECRPLQESGLKVLLTVRNNGNNNMVGRVPTSPPQDIEAYTLTVGKILDAYKPYMLVVENEENSEVFYTGTPDQYGRQLDAACEASHARGIPCTNGGLVSGEVALLVWADYFEAGRRAEACDYATRAFGPEGAQACSITDLSQLPARSRSLLEEGRQLIEVYRASSIDYMNFHWYIDDVRALDESVAYLKRVTGKPLITNEMGQLDTNPDTVRRLMQATLDQELPIAIWFSVDRKAQALQNDDGTLRPNGQAFKSFIGEHFGPGGSPRTPVPSATRFAVGPRFTDYYNQHAGPAVLGPPIGPQVGEAQYFEKGRLEDRRPAVAGEWAFSYGLLVPELINAASQARVAGGQGPTYAELGPATARDRLVPSPRGAGGLAFAPDGSVFVPFDPYLASDRGHLVPAYFWAYMNNQSLFPAGWLHDIGLPLSEPFAISIEKGGQTRSVIIQVFERTILSFDLANPPGFTVERANIGLSYRDTFPERVVGDR